MTQLLQYFNAIATVFASVIVIATVWVNQRYIKEQIKNLNDMIREQIKKHDEHELIFYEKHSNHENRIRDLENKLDNIHMYGCNRRNSFNCREDVNGTN